MALNAVLESLDDVPETMRAEYKAQEKDGKTLYVLEVAGVDDHPAVVNLKNAYERVKADKSALSTELRDAKTRLDELPEDFSVDEWNRLKAEADARQNDPDGKNVQQQITAATEALKNQHTAALQRQKEQYEQKLKDKDAEIAKRDQVIENVVGADRLRQALIAAGVKKGLIDGAVAMFRSKIEVVEEDGEHLARMIANEGGDTVENFISNWAQSDAAKEWIAPAVGDDELGGGPRKLSADNPFTPKGWNKTAQGRLMRDNRGKAEQLAKQAGFASLDEAIKALDPPKAA